MLYSIWEDKIHLNSKVEFRHKITAIRNQPMKVNNRTAICIITSLLIWLPASLRAAVIYSDVDPAVTNILTLAEPIAGAFEDNNNNNTGVKVIHGWGRVVNIATAGTLRTAILPFNVGASAGLRIDVFQLPPPPYANRSGIVTTTNFVQSGVFGLGGISRRRASVGDLLV